MMKILILASNPRKDLNLDDEIRLLRNVVDQSRDRDQFEIVSEPGVRVGDLQGLLLRHKPQIVHFCGHGGGEAGLIFKMDGGGEQRVGADALAGMFQLNPISSNVKCVLLNACYTEVQANAIVSSIDYVVGMSHEIQDDAAIAFSKGFYLALGYGCSIDDAFEFGKSAVHLEISGSSKMRSALTEVERKLEVIDNVVATTVIPEHLKPILKKRSTLILEASPNTLSQETKVEIQLGIDKSLEVDPKVEQYRDRVRLYLADRKLTEVEKIRLKQFQNDLGLSQTVAEEILKEEQAPIHRSQQHYRDLLNELIEGGLYPFNETIQNELKQCQREENLTDGEIEEISRPILAAAETAYQEKLRLQTQRQREQEEEERRKRIKTALGVTLQRFNFDVITVNKNGNENSRTRNSAESFARDLGNGVSLEMVLIPEGTYLMGSPTGQGDDDERYQNSVTVSSFFLGKYPITQAQWRAVAALPQVEIPLDPDLSYFKGDDRPVEQVSWDEVVEFCQRISRSTGHQYRLSSEAEWEYACRAGTTTPFYFGEMITTELANYNGNYIYAGGSKGSYRQETTPVGQFFPNAFGLYDMHGNVWEWCADHWHSSYYDAPTDGSAWITGGNSESRLVRGGSWGNSPANCRSANRDNESPADRNFNIGFRVFCGLFP